ncbi:MAG: 3-deoxy-D-manno-octulosonic acid transferase [Rhodobacteraceae bacterium]|nr:3-deoxy-D-manno-octulosonic acid transferase [Paracoccaceae bacterium]
MAGSLGLAAYRALAQRGEGTGYVADQPRPRGEVVWFHAPEPGSLRTVLDIAARVNANRPGLHAVITVERGSRPDHAGSDETLCVTEMPDDHPRSIAAFLDHWKPDACVWFWGRLQPNLILDPAARDCPLLLVDADTGGFDGRRDRWLRDLTRELLSHFDAILVRSQAGFRRLTHLGAPPTVLRITEPLMPGGKALPCADSDLAEMSKALKGRPVWFANRVLPEELNIVLTAHRHALRLSHRLLLILFPSDPAQAEQMAEQAATRDFRVLRWGSDIYPEDSTQVLVAEDPGDMGLFYRVAPVSFLGSSLVADHGGGDPFEAAALGSAVLYGPNVRRFLPAYSRLAATGAARIVNDAVALGTAVSRLIAPDQAATMAHAGWDVVSEGAAQTDRVTDLIIDALDGALSGGN